MHTSKGKISGIGVVRNSDGYIRTGNYDNLTDIQQKILKALIAVDDYITAESFPHKDSRFFEE